MRDGDAHGLLADAGQVVGERLALGVGERLLGLHRHLFVEAKYLSVSTSGNSVNMIPIVAGIQFGGGI